MASSYDPFNPDDYIESSEFFTNPADSLNNLHTAKQTKLNSLSQGLAPQNTEWEQVTLQDLYDLDSPRFPGVTGGVGSGKRPDGTFYDKTGQSSVDRINGIDAYEAFPSSEDTLIRQTQDINGMRQMALQRSRLATERNVDPSTITNEDVYEEGAKRLVKEAALVQAYSLGDEKLIEQVRQWEPSKELTEQWRTSAPDLSNFLKGNVQVERKFTGEYDHYGRPLSIVRPLNSKYLLGAEGGKYIYNDPTEYVGAVDKEDFADAYQRAMAERMGFGGRLANAGKAFARTFLKEVGVDLVDVVGEGLSHLTNDAIGWDVGTEEEKTAFVNEFVGFNPYAAEAELAQAKVYATRLADGLFDENKEINFRDVYELVKLGITTPELFGDSAGFLASFFVPMLGWASKGSKAAKTAAAAENIRSIQKAVKVGDIKADIAKAAITAEKANIHVLGKLQNFAQRNAGLLQVSANNVNDQIDAYSKEHGAAPSIYKVGQMFATEAVLLGMDRWTDLSILKSPAALKGVRDAFSVMAPEGKAKVLSKALTNSIGVIASIGKEAGQEYLQEIGQEFNVRFNFDDNDGFVSAVDEAGDVLLSKDMQIMGILGAGLGAGGAVQLAGVGAALPTAVRVSKGAKRLGERVKEHSPSGRNETIQEEDVAPTYDENIEDEVVEEEVLTRNAEDANKAANSVIKKYSSMFAPEELGEILEASTEDKEKALDLPKFKAALSGKVKKYRNALEEIETAEATIEARKDTDKATPADEAAVKILRKTKHELYKSYMEDPNDITLGSGFAPEDIIEEFLDTADTVDGKAVVSDEDKKLIAAFSELNEVPEFRFKALVESRINPPQGKDAKAVYDESSGEGSRSVTSYRSKLRTLVNTPNPSRKAVSRTINDIDRFLQTQETRLGAYKKVTDTLAEDMANYNAQLAKGKKLPKKVGEALLGKQKVEGYGFVVGTQNKQTGEIEIHPSSMNIIRSMEDNIAHLRRTKQRYGKKAHSILGGEFKADTSEGIVVRPNTKHQTVRDQDETFYKNRNVTKAIVDTKTKIQWSKNGDYRVDNESITNKGDYSADDVVVVHSTAKNFVEGSDFAKELNKAYRAGATIVLDNDKTVVSNKKLKGFLKQYHYEQVEVDGIVQFKPTDEAKPIKEEAARVKAEAAHDKKLKERALAALNFKASLEGKSFGQALKEKLITKQQLDNYHKAITEAEHLYKNKAEMEKEYQNKVDKDTAELTKEFISAVTTYGIDSAELDTVVNKAVEGAGKRKVFHEVLARSMETLDETVERLSTGGELLNDWHAAVKDDKEGKASLKEWIENNIPSPRQITEHMFNNALGAGRGVAYTYFANAREGFVSATKKRLNVPKDTPYQVLELDPYNYVAVTETTPLNSLSAQELHMGGAENIQTNYILDDSKELLESALEDINKNYEANENSIISIANSPATSLIYDKDRQVNENMAIAARIGLYTFIRNSGYLLAKGKKSKKDIAQILGMDESQVSREAVKLMQDKGLLMKTVTDSIGKDIANMMGFSRKSDSEADKQAYDALLADLGLMAVTMGIQEGLLERDNTLSARKYAKEVLGKEDNYIDDLSDAKVLFVQFPKGKEKDTFESTAETAKAIAKTIPVTNTLRKEPSFRKLTDEQMDKAISKVHKERLGLKIAGRSKKALKTLMSTRWVADLKLMQDMVDNKDVLKYRLGYVDISDNNEDYVKLSFEARETQEAVNRGIDKSIEEMEQLLKDNEGKTKVSMWFKYYFSKNGRFFIDSNTINPQTDKHLHRFTTQPASHTKTYTSIRGAKKGDAPRFKIGKQDVSNEVYYALSQAFGFSTDKADTDRINDFAKAVFKKLLTVEAVAEAKEEFMKTGKYDLGNGLEMEIEHLGHALQGFQFLSDLRTSPKKFTSALTAEFDAVTSGFGLKNLQMPIIDNMQKWLKKVGVVLPNDPDLEQASKLSMNDLLDSGNVRDSYQELASGIVDTAFEDMAAEAEIIDTGYARKVWEALSEVLPSTEVGEKVNPELRNLFKYPFMTFNYSASIKSIRKNLLTGELLKGVASQIAEADLAEDTPVTRLMAAYLGLTEGSKTRSKRLAKLQERVRTEPLYLIKKNVKDSTNLETYLGRMIEGSYGAQVESILTEQFGPFVKAQNKINASFKAMFEAFFIAFEEEMTKARKEGPVSAAKEREIYDSLKARWPMISGPLSEMEGEYRADSDLDGVGIYDTVTAAPLGVHSGRKPVRLALSKQLGGKIGSDSIRVSHMVKQLSAAIAAGSVVPIHYIDGAVMGETINGLSDKGVKGITAIHDAIMPPIDGMHEAQQEYNKQVLTIGSTYNFVNEILTSFDRVIDETPLQEKKYKDHSIEYKDALGKSHKMPLSEYVYKARNELALLVNDINEGREYLFNNLLKDGVHIMHMAGTPAGVYTATGDDINYTPVEKIKPRAYNSQAKNKQTMENVDDLAQHLTCKGS